MHILCTICSDLVNQAENIFVTKCGHIFHHHCLLQWIVRSKSCPQCRCKVTEKCMFRLYPTISNESSGDDAATLQSRLDDSLLQLRQQTAACKEKEEKISELNGELKHNGELIKTYEKRLASKEFAVAVLKEQLEYLKIQNKETNKLKEENQALNIKIKSLEGLEKVLNATENDVETMLKGYNDVNTIALFATALKRALCESESKKNELRDKLHLTKQQLAVEKSVVAKLQSDVMQLNDKLHNATRKYEALKRKRKSAEIDKSTREETVKQPRLSKTIDLDTTNNAVMETSQDVSLNTMVKRIEDADSPYLNLKQSSIALALAARTTVPDTAIKPSEFAIINSARHTLKASENMPLSIFHKKQPVKPELSKPIPLDVSYDGLGGHSKLDTFPTPTHRPMLKCLPKVGAKHKLKRPAPPAGNHDITKLFQKMSQDS